jgi:hypothetical protein
VRIESDELTFSSGTKVYANRGIVGIAITDEGIRIYEGYDGGIDVNKRDGIELADYMIALWQKYKESLD